MSGKPACSICSRPDREAIEEAVRSGETYRNIASRSGCSTSALSRHLNKHTAQRGDRKAADGGAGEAARLLDTLERLTDPKGPPRKRTEREAVEAADALMSEYMARWLAKELDPEDRRRVADIVEAARARRLAADIAEVVAWREAHGYGQAPVLHPERGVTVSGSGNRIQAAAGGPAEDPNRQDAGEAEIPAQPETGAASAIVVRPGR